MNDDAPLPVAVVDDSISIVTMMVQLLESIEGCRPIGFTDSAKALAWCLENEVALVIVDHQMPPPDGIVFITEFRRDQRKVAVPVVMVTSSADKTVRYTALQMGATDFLAKPVDRFEFTARMRNLLGFYRTHKALEEASRYLTDEARKSSMVVKQSPASVIITDREGVIEYVNPKFVEATGYRSDEVIGQELSIINSRHMKDGLYREILNTVRSGKEWHGTFHSQRKDGNLFWESSIISPIRDDCGMITHFVAINEDITARKKLEMELVAAKEHAEAGNEAKTQFLSIVGHELRTPLNAIIGFSDMMAEDNDPTCINDRYRSFSKIITERAKSLLEILDGILKFSNISSLSVIQNPERVSATDLCKGAVDSVRLRAEDARVRLVTDIPDLDLYINGDESALRDALVRILLNGIKFSKMDGIVEFQLRAEHDGYLTMVIADDGIGIAADKIEQVMIPFVQADNSYSRRYEGTGIGLPLARRLIESHGGTLGIKSEIGVGTTVTIGLPPNRLG
ncbi:MAG: PAS domain S-box protein [Rhodospirillaceae bacterium]